MSLLLFGLVFISPPFLKKLLLRWFAGADIGPHAQIGWLAAVMGEEISLGAYSAIKPLTIIKVDGAVKIGAYSEISSFNLIYGSSSLFMGDGSYIGPQCLINVDEPVRLGNDSALGPRTMVFTHGSYLPYNEGYWVKLSGVSVGDKVWCAAGVFIHPGVEIGDNSFVNSKSVVTQSIPPGSVVEGNPAQVIYPMARVQRKMSPKRVDVALRQILNDFAEVGLRRELGLKSVSESKGELQFDLNGQKYDIRLVPSTANGAVSSPVANDSRQIYVVNSPKWSPPAGSLAFKLATMDTPYTTDRVHTALRLFMLRYYGMRFKDENLSSSINRSGRPTEPA